MQEPGDPVFTLIKEGSHCEFERSKTMMNGYRESDSFIVPEKLSNKITEVTAEIMEGRELAKGNPPGQNICRTQSRESMRNELERIRKAAKKDKDLKFTALLHHVYNINTLREAYYSVNRDAVPGVDNETWMEYGKGLEERLQDLSERIKRGGYKVKPVRRVYIPKGVSGERSIGVLALEDKIVQRAMVEVLNKIYEVDFKGFSYGFRPGRSAHNALDALYIGLGSKISYVLDADISTYFDNISHEWLIKFVEHRIGDRRVLKLIRKWLKAGIMDGNNLKVNEKGTVQGGSVSPLLANIYLHYVFDLWVDQWRKKRARGEVIVVRYADDIITGFQYKSDAENFLEDLKLRFKKFCLELHAEKTRLIEFGRFAIERRKERGEGKPDTFNFLGFTHICSKTRKGRFNVLRYTIKSRLQRKLKEVKVQLRKRMHNPVKETGKWLSSVVRGHMNYYGISGNSKAINLFRFRIGRLWCKSLRRRSQKHRITWDYMEKIIKRFIPAAKIIHPYPDIRRYVNTRGGSRMR